MCSSILNIVFLAFLVTGIGLLVASFVTPAWKKVKAQIDVNKSQEVVEAVREWKNATNSSGLLCFTEEECKEWWNVSR